MKSISILLLSLFIPVFLFAQHGSFHQEIHNNIHQDIKAEQEAKAEKPVEEALDRLDRNDSANRAMVKPFPKLHLTVRTVFPDKPSYNHTSDSYLKGFELATKKVYDDPKRNRNDDDRTIINYKTGKSITLQTDKKGKKMAVEFDFKTMGWAISGGAKKSNRDYLEGKNSCRSTTEYKEISGQKCRKYIKEEATGITEMWIASDLFLEGTDLSGPMSTAFLGASASAPNTFNNYNEGIRGFPVQTIYTPQNKGGLKCIITYEKIEKGVTNADIFSTAGYDVKPMPTIRDLWNSRE